ncbi:TonB-dependent siderophore receptor [Sphingobium herbicidovorans NBRC 16415]|uniref:TonB-dependent siderophore receptor n=1 Tax=Sphingobium herbicidovorans (strain ATCC 700291 / DSM 11019 / CCUG 56400 / KCTC 2939 / LMG 18315 / NBRC 16415 / MH) TaxID=1219045 RepID=A0A086PE72_SPHHM|nr:TonB-dependent siderophore receptor [Sphingobium herbicidovorans NBRC 16415]
MITAIRAGVFDIQGFARALTPYVGGAPRLRNIFGREYIVPAHRTVGKLNMPGAPRSVMLTLRYAID